MYLIDTRKYDDSFLLAKILEKVDITDEEKKKLFKHFEKPEVVDIVEVVRCKDCKWWKYEETEEDTLYGECCVDMYFGSVPTVGHHFCSNGERKEDVRSNDR